MMDILLDYFISQIHAGAFLGGLHRFSETSQSY